MLTPSSILLPSPVLCIKVRPRFSFKLPLFNSINTITIINITNIVKVREGKESVATREPDLKKELKRGSMKEKWGLTLVHRSCW